MLAPGTLPQLCCGLVTELSSLHDRGEPASVGGAEGTKATEKVAGTEQGATVVAGTNATEVVHVSHVASTCVSLRFSRLQRWR